MTTEASLPADDGTEEPVDEIVEATPQPEQPQDPVLDEIVDEPVEAEASDDGLKAAVATWTEALLSVQRSIDGAAEAIRFLRATIQQMAPLMQSLGGLEEAMHSFEQPPRPRPVPRSVVEYDDDEAGAAESASSPPHDDAPQSHPDWPAQRRKPAPKEKPARGREAESLWAPSAGPARPSLKPVTLVPDDTPAPYAYRVTIEDRKGPVELVMLHRALTSRPSVRNLSLLNYVSGVASLSLESTDEIEPPELENAVKKIMKRSCSVVPHESNVILIQVGE